MSHYGFFFGNVCNVWIKKKKKWGGGEGCELWRGNERKKNEMGEGGCMCVVQCIEKNWKEKN